MSARTVSMQWTAVRRPVVSLDLFPQRGNRKVQPVGQLAVRIAGHDAGVQNQPEQPAVGIGHGVHVSEVNTVGDGLGLRDKGFPLIGRIAEFPENRFDKILVAQIRATPRPRHDASIIRPSDQRQFKLRRSVG